MNNRIRNFVIGISTVLSLSLILMLIAFLVAPMLNVTPPFTKYGSVFLIFFGSPLVFLLALFSVWTSCYLSTRLWIKASLATINGFGALVAGYFTVILIGLMMIGPINPG